MVVVALGNIVALHALMPLLTSAHLFDGGDRDHIYAAGRIPLSAWFFTVDSETIRLSDFCRLMRLLKGRS